MEYEFEHDKKGETRGVDQKSDAWSEAYCRGDLRAAFLGFILTLTIFHTHRHSAYGSMEW
jgi:hypothetical protein